MDLGAFSVSLTVKDLAVSKEFYEKLGFEVTGGAVEHNYLILVNRGTVIGLFQGMFDKNILTFNPGLGGPDMTQLEEFTDVREIQRALKKDGVELTEEVEEGTSGPAHIAFLDPDGNPILIDQFF